MGVKSTVLTSGLSGGSTMEQGSVSVEGPHEGGNKATLLGCSPSCPTPQLILLLNHRLMVQPNTFSEPKARQGGEGYIFSFS